MARKVMRTIRDAREELSSEILSVDPILNNTTPRTAGVDDDFMESTDEDILFTKEDDAAIKASGKEEKNNHRRGGSCGCRN